MSPFWTGLFENLRGRGKNPTWFIVALPLVLVGVTMAARIPADVYENRVMPSLPWIGLLGAVWFGRVILKARARRRDKLNFGRLSDDELCKARSKLGTQRFGRQNSLFPRA